MTEDQDLFHIIRHLGWAASNTSHPPEAIEKLNKARELTFQAFQIIVAAYMKSYP